MNRQPATIHRYARLAAAACIITAASIANLSNLGCAAGYSNPLPPADPVYNPPVGSPLSQPLGWTWSRDGTAPPPIGGIPQPPPPPPAEPMTEQELALAQQILERVNSVRRSRALPEFITHQPLVSVALDHSRDMLQRNYFSHIDPDGKTPFDRLRNANISFSFAGENISQRTTAQTIVDEWMSIPTQRANILDTRPGQIGIAVHNLQAPRTTALFRAP